MSKTAKYQAVVGIDFEGLTPAVRVEQGDILPPNVDIADIKQLLEDGHIKEVPVNAKRSSIQ